MIPLTVYAVAATEGGRTLHADELRAALGAAWGATYHSRGDAEHARRVLTEERELLHRGEGLRYWLVSLEPDESGRIVSVCLDLQGCYSDGETIPEAVAMVTDAIALHEGGT